MAATGPLASIVLALLSFSGSLALTHEHKLEIACTTNNAQPGWLTFVNRTHRFCFQYPPQYRRHKPLRKRYLLPDTKLLAFFTNGKPLRFGKHGEWPAASMTVLFSSSPFSPDHLLKYAPNGPEAPTRVQVGSHTFYAWGAGGGGANYADIYHHNLNGQTLTLIFDGPYNPGEKSPTLETHDTELKVLLSFRTF
jgi:hypothetical protein